MCKARSSYSYSHAREWVEVEKGCRARYQLAESMLTLA